MTDNEEEEAMGTIDRINERMALDKTVQPADMAIDPQLMAAIRTQIMAELDSKEERELHKRRIIREEASKAHKEYVERMKISPDPWVDIQGWVETADGVRIELDWNDAFVLHLKSEGVSGADDDQVVQRWVTLLLRDMTNQLEEESPETSEFS